MKLIVLTLWRLLIYIFISNQCKCFRQLEFIPGIRCQWVHSESVMVKRMLWTLIYLSIYASQIYQKKKVDNKKIENTNTNKKKNKNKKKKN